MTDTDIVRAFEDRTLPPERFRHRDHLLVAWTYLRALPFAEAGALFAGNLRLYAKAHGAEAKYHETITWAYLALLNERMRACSEEATFAELLARNPDLLDQAHGALAAVYDADTLASPLARATFVLPRPRPRALP
jgi:hypothetical protein